MLFFGSKVLTSPTKCCFLKKKGRQRLPPPPTWNIRLILALTYPCLDTRANGTAASSGKNTACADRAIDLPDFDPDRARPAAPKSALDEGINLNCLPIQGLVSDAKGRLIWDEKRYLAWRKASIRANNEVSN